MTGEPASNSLEVTVSWKKRETGLETVYSNVIYLSEFIENIHDRIIVIGDIIDQFHQRYKVYPSSLSEAFL